MPGEMWSHQEHACQQWGWKGKEERSWCLGGRPLPQAHDWIRLLADSKSASVLEKVSQVVNPWVWYQFFAFLRGPAPLFMSCSFQHPEAICTALHIKALCKNHFFFSLCSLLQRARWHGRQNSCTKCPFYIRQHLNRAVRWVWPRSHWSQWVLLSRATTMRLGLMLLRHYPVIVHTSNSIFPLTNKQGWMGASCFPGCFLQHYFIPTFCPPICSIPVTRTENIPAF